ncbi:hypothetical protein BH11PSE12_BH11PSE12_32250 [soil metagenome]
MLTVLPGDRLIEGIFYINELAAEVLLNDVKIESMLFA